MLKRNLVANFLGRGWSALMGIVFVPIYIKYIGMEAFGLIGLFAVVQAWLVILDMGMTPTLVRELARFSAGARDARSVRDLLRTVEIVALAVAFVLVLSAWLVSDWVAQEWLRVEGLSPGAVSLAFLLMAAVTALRFLEGIFQAVLIGQQYQVTCNVINATAATLRGAGAIGALAWIAPTIEVFFVWQVVISLATLCVYLVVVYRGLPPVRGGGVFSVSELAGIRQYAGGMLAITFLSLLLTQVDKIILSRMLTLTDFGYYTLAVLVASVTSIVLTPIVQAWFPRMSEAYAASNPRLFSEAYHSGAQLVSVLVGSVALLLLVFGEDILFLWTQDAAIARESALLVKLLVLGNLFNAFMTIPYHAQLAYGVTRLAIFINLFAVFTIIPALLYVTPRYGVTGAAAIWALLNFAYVVVGVQFMYRIMLREEKWRWYFRDVIAPTSAGGLVAFLVHSFKPDFDSQIAEMLSIGFAGILIVTSMVVACPLVYKGLVSFCRATLSVKRASL